jgi:putative FmdB family regulatory protein
MPIYEYRRPDGTTFELMQSFSDEPLTEDPESGVPVERVMHAPAVHFKGKGFYNTDYGTRKRQRETSSSSEGSSSSTGSSTAADKADSASKSTTSGTDGSSSHKKDSGPAKAEKVAASSAG